MCRFLTALRYAIDGVAYGVKTQRHVRFHLCAASAAIALGWFVNIQPVQWAILLLTIAIVLAAELFNTAIEAVVDLVSPEHHRLAKAAKDVAAGAVLVVAIVALLIGITLFGPYLLCLGVFRT